MTSFIHRYVSIEDEFLIQGNYFKQSYFFIDTIFYKPLNQIRRFSNNEHFCYMRRSKWKPEKFEVENLKKAWESASQVSLTNPPHPLLHRQILCHSHFLRISPYCEISFDGISDVCRIPCPESFRRPRCPPGEQQTNHICIWNHFHATTIR